jgi:hypothetical protein
MYRCQACGGPEGDFHRPGCPMLKSPLPLASIVMSHTRLRRDRDAILDSLIKRLVANARTPGPAVQ